MLATAQRLRRREEFTSTIRAGRHAGRGAVVAHVLVPGAAAPRPRSAAAGDVGQLAASGPRVGFIIPRAVGNAVVRNRVRRRLRHLMRERLGVLPEGACVVIRALPQAATRSYGDLAADLVAAVAATSRARRPRSRPEVSR